MTLGSFINIVLSTCTTSEKEDENPKICDCQNEQKRLLQETALSGHEATHTRLMKKCDEIYGALQIMDTACGLKYYDPNFKAK